nr:peptidoglycan-binding domain-containing protein [Micromonospora sp. DSM 115978]
MVQLSFLLTPPRQSGGPAGGATFGATSSSATNSGAANSGATTPGTTRSGAVEHDVDKPDVDLFDPALDRAVRAFQLSRGLSAVGVIGPDTFRALDEARHKLGDRLLYH